MAQPKKIIQTINGLHSFTPNVLDNARTLLGAFGQGNLTELSLSALPIKMEIGQPTLTYTVNALNLAFETALGKRPENGRYVSLVEEDGHPVQIRLQQKEFSEKAVVEKLNQMRQEVNAAHRLLYTEEPGTMPPGQDSWQQVQAVAQKLGYDGTIVPDTGGMIKY